MPSADSRPRRGRPPQANRPTLIADAAIRLLAENGSRSLSHRRVDKEAGLPVGSTVHHAPTRNDLLLLAARRLSEITQEEMKPFSASIRAKGSALGPDDVAKGMVELWRPRLGKDQLYRLRAEMAILLSQDIEGELRALLRAQIEEIVRFWQTTMDLLGCRTPEEAGSEFSLWSRGLFYMLAVRGGIHDRDVAAIQKWIAHFLASLLDENYTSEPIESGIFGWLTPRAVVLERSGQ